MRGISFAPCKYVEFSPKSYKLSSGLASYSPYEIPLEKKIKNDSSSSGFCALP